MPKNYVILGKMPTKYMANFKDPDCCIITMGKHYDMHLIPRVDKVFDIHKNPTNIDINTIHRDSFPFKECESLLGGFYFISTMSYIIAWCILQGAEKISIYGATFEIDHMHRDKERQNVRELIFFAKGRGIDIYDYDGVITREYQRPTSDLMDFDSDFDL